MKTDAELQSRYQRGMLWCTIVGAATLVALEIYGTATADISRLPEGGWRVFWTRSANPVIVALLMTGLAFACWLRSRFDQASLALLSINATTAAIFSWMGFFLLRMLGGGDKLDNLLVYAVYIVCGVPIFLVSWIAIRQIESMEKARLRRPPVPTGVSTGSSAGGSPPQVVG